MTLMIKRQCGYSEVFIVKSLKTKNTFSNLFSEKLLVNPISSEKGANWPPFSFFSAKLPNENFFIFETSWLWRKFNNTHFHKNGWGSYDRSSGGLRNVQSMHSLPLPTLKGSPPKMPRVRFLNICLRLKSKALQCFISIPCIPPLV